MIIIGERPAEALSEACGPPGGFVAPGDCVGLASAASAFGSLAVFSPPEALDSSGSQMATDVMGSECPRKTILHGGSVLSGTSQSHNRAVPSQLPVSTDLPLRENATAATFCATSGTFSPSLLALKCSLGGPAFWLGSPKLVFQIRTTPSWLPVTICLPSLERASAEICVCEAVASENILSGVVSVFVARSEEHTSEL